MNISRYCEDEACFGDAEDGFDEGVEECDDILEAPLDLCESRADATYGPETGDRVELIEFTTAE